MEFLLKERWSIRIVGAMLRYEVKDRCEISVESVRAKESLDGFDVLTLQGELHRLFLLPQAKQRPFHISFGHIADEPALDGALILVPPSFNPLVLTQRMHRTHGLKRISVAKPLPIIREGGIPDILQTDEHFVVSGRIIPPGCTM